MTGQCNQKLGKMVNLFYNIRMVTNNRQIWQAGFTGLGQKLRCPIIYHSMNKILEQNLAKYTQKIQKKKAYSLKIVVNAQQNGISAISNIISLLNISLNRPFGQIRINKIRQLKMKRSVLCSANFKELFSVNLSHCIICQVLQH